MSFGTSIKAVFGADTAPLQKGAGEAEGILQKLTGSASSLIGGLSVAAAVGFTKSIIDSAGKLADLSERLGVSTDALQSFEFAGKMAGASTTEITQMWDRGRKSIDGLMAGTEAQTALFAKLHLTQQDLAGLPLEAQIEKIAKAYQAAKGEAGAYEAITEILGAKSAPKLLVALDQLAGEGFDGLAKSARAAGQVVESEFIASMDRLGDSLNVATGALKTAAGNVVGFFLNAMEKVGTLAGGVVYGGDAMVEALRKPGQAASELAEKIEVTTKAVTRQLASKQQLAALEAEDFKRLTDALPIKDRILALENRALELRVQAANAGQGTAEWAEKELAARRAFAEAAKLAAAEDKAAATAREQAADEHIRQQDDLLRRERERKDLAEKQRREAEGLDQPLAEQARRLVDQGTSLDQIVDTLRGRGFQEGEILKTLGLQTAEVNKVYTMSIQIKRATRTDDQLSDRELAEKIANMQRVVELDAQNRAMGGWGDFAAFLVRPDLQRAQEEQARRNRFRSQYSIMGERAFDLYSAFDEQTLRNYIRPEDERRAQQTLSTLQNIDARLRSAGLTTF